GLVVLVRGRSRPIRTSCCTVGIALSSALSSLPPVLRRRRSDLLAGPRKRSPPGASFVGHSTRTHNNDPDLSGRRRRCYRGTGRGVNEGPTHWPRRAFRQRRSFVSNTPRGRLA